MYKTASTLCLSVFLLAGCYDPAPAPGLACTELGQCPKSQSCDLRAGLCVFTANLTCTAPALACDDECVDTENDVANCGGCGIECGPRSACRGGECAPADSVVDCEDSLHNGNESDVDCGGGCSPCPEGGACIAAQDCITGRCESGVCKSCSANTDCEEGSYCNASSACEEIVLVGQGCQSDGGCETGFCTDGVCCEARCGDGCETCNAEGACVPVAAGVDSDGACPIDGECGNTGACDGNRGCEIASAGTSCSLESCAGGSAGTGECSGIGACEAIVGASCSPYACGPQDACLETCAGTADCADGYFCSGGACIEKQEDGASCTGGEQCISGSCADGVCCNTDCSGTCQSCAIPGSVGTCTPFAEDTDPDDECSAQGAATCGRVGTCSGSSSCKLWPAGTSCGGAGCENHRRYQNGSCNGSGSCIRPSTSCNGYTCNGAVCGTSCNLWGSAQGCHPSRWCNGATLKQCVPDYGSGVFCLTDAQCLSGTCVPQAALGGRCQ